MKKSIPILIIAMLAASIPAAAAAAFGGCSSWSVVYARTQAQCACRQVRDRGGRTVWTCN